MSEITVNIIDNSRSINGYVHGSIGEEMVATLTAEPETIEEFEAAFKRFQPPDSELGILSFFSEGFDPEAFDAGILVIDLAARAIVSDTTYSELSTEGTVGIKVEDEGCFPLPYKLSPDWKLFTNLEESEFQRERLRESRKAAEIRDQRAILYGDPLFEYIASERESNRGNDDEDLIVDIHAKWLMTPREDLGGSTPREALLERHDFIVADLHSRELQWAFTKHCPPPLSVDSDAYRFAGFGTNEIVVYYDLVRSLIHAAFGVDDVSSDELRDLARSWMAAPQDDLSGRIPAEVVDAERRRVNLTVSPIECLIDEECEICQMLAADFDNPMFWGLDGSSMELDRFEFSLFQTVEEFEEDRRRFEEFNREFEARYAESKVFDEEIV